MISQNEMLMTMQDVARRLNALGINYMVTGSVAMGLYVPARTTFDIDIVVEISSADSQRFEASFRDDYYVDETSIIRANDRESMFNIINNTTLVKVDCIVKKRDRFEIEKFERRIKTEIGGEEFWVIGKEDLILSKLRWASESHSERQFEDIDRLLVSGIENQPFLDNIAKLGLEQVWEVFSQWKIRAKK